MQLVARKGAPAPGTGVNFRLLDFPLLNASGQTAFFGSLTGWGVDSTNDRGIWAEGLSGQLTLIAHTGDQLDVDDGSLVDLRTISFLSFTGNTGNGDGRPSGFNNLGQLAFGAVFTDSSRGVFVSILVAVPEPGTLLLGTPAVSILCLRMRRRASHRPASHL